MTLSIQLTEEDIDKTLTCTLEIFSPNNDSRLQLLHNSTYTAVDVERNGDFQCVTVSKVIVNPEGVELFVNTLGNLDCYVDNINIKVQ